MLRPLTYWRYPIWRLAKIFRRLLGDQRYSSVLTQAAMQARRRNPATFIGVTGSSGKSTTTALLAHILAAQSNVRSQIELNTQGHLCQTLVHVDRRNEFVVAEVGILRPGHIQSSAEILRPNVAVVTLIELEHKSIFRSIEGVAAEKAELVAALQPGGLAVLNADDPLVMGMAEKTRARVVTFGRSQNTDFRAIDIRSGFPDRLSMTVVWKGGSVPLRTNFVGDHFWLPVLAAAATAIELGVPADVVATRIASFAPLLERCGVISAPDGPHFILDTTKAPWHSVRLAIDIVSQASAPRKRIVVGHMSDFSGSDQKYRDVYRWARAAADQVIFVGDHAHRSKASQQDRDEERFLAFATPQQVSDYIRRTAIPGELILIKGSVDLHLERIALAWIHDVKCWVPSCGKILGCVHCGQYKIPYERQKDRAVPRRKVEKARLGFR